MLVIVAVPHRGNPGSMSEARFRAMADRVANKIVEHYKSSTGNFTLLEKRFEMRDGLPHLFIRSSFRATVNGKPGKEMILSVCIIASSPEVYSFALRETKERYDSDPGRFEKMVGKIKIRK